MNKQIETLTEAMAIVFTIKETIIIQSQTDELNKLLSVLGEAIKHEAMQDDHFAAATSELEGDHNEH